MRRYIPTKSFTLKIARALLLAVGLSGYFFAAQASEVTTQRIVTMPEFSASSPDFPVTVGPNGEGSGTSSVTIDGETRSVAPLIGADGLPVSPSDDVPAPAHYFAPLVQYGQAGLPPSVLRTHQAIHSALLSGDLNALRTAMQMNEMPPSINLGSEDGDPIEQIRALSGDDDGIEILAILAEILEAGYAHVDVGTPQEMYVWPYFAYHRLDQLSRQQKVELLRLMTAGEFAEMEALGQYIFFRIGIGPDGTWHYLQAGE